MKKLLVNKIILYFIALCALGAVFVSYSNPNLMVAFADLMYSCF